MYFDTGSSDFTVASTNCPNSKCGTKDRYDVAASSTAVQTSTYVRTNFVDGTTSEGSVSRRDLGFPNRTDATLRAAPWFATLSASPALPCNRRTSLRPRRFLAVSPTSTRTGESMTHPSHRSTRVD